MNDHNWFLRADKEDSDAQGCEHDTVKHIFRPFLKVNIYTQKCIHY